MVGSLVKIPHCRTSRARGKQTKICQLVLDLVVHSVYFQMCVREQSSTWGIDGVCPTEGLTVCPRKEEWSAAKQQGALRCLRCAVWGSFVGGFSSYDNTQMLHVWNIYLHGVSGITTRENNYNYKRDIHPRSLIMWAPLVWSWGPAQTTWWLTARCAISRFQ